MTILFLNHNYLNVGTYFRCYFFEKEIIKLRKNYEVILICANNEIAYKVKRLKRKGVKHILLPKLKHDFLWGHILRTIYCSFYVLKINYDFLHSFAVSQPVTAVPTVLVKIFRRRKKIFVDWDDLWTNGIANTLPPFLRIIEKFFEMNTPKLADKITVASTYLNSLSKKYFKNKKIYKLPNGVNQDELLKITKEEAKKEVGLKSNYKYITSVGNSYMDKQCKCLDNLFDIFKEYLNKFNDKRMHLLVIGNFSNKIIESYKRKYRNIWPKIIFVGLQPYEKVKYFLRASDILILPMEDNDIEKARSPVRLGDFIIAGVPIISNGVGEVKETIKKYQFGLISPPDDINKAAGNINKLISNKELYNNIVGNIEKDRARLSWTKNAQILLSKVYEI